MPFPNIELPSDFHVEPLKKPFDKRDNLRHFGRVKGVPNKICRDLKNGLLDAAIEHGADGTGAGGLRGYLLMLATRYPKTFAGMLTKLLPHQIDGAHTGAITSVHVHSVPVGKYLSEAEIAALNPPADVLALRQLDAPEPSIEPAPACKTSSIEHE